VKHRRVIAHTTRSAATTDCTRGTGFQSIGASKTSSASSAHAFAKSGSFFLIVAIRLDSRFMARHWSSCYENSRFCLWAMSTGREHASSSLATRSSRVPEELENWHHWVADEETLIKALDLRHFAIVYFDHENRLPAHPRAKRLIRRKPAL